METLARLTDLELRLYKLTTKSHLRIGAGEASVSPSAVELPLIRALLLEEGGKEKRVPYIPGSSLHGVIRAWTEKVLKSLQEPLAWEELERRVLERREKYEKAYEEAKRKAIEDFKPILGESPSEAQLKGYWQVYKDLCDPLLDVDRCELLEGDEAKAPKKQWVREVIGREIPCTVCQIFGYMGRRGKVRITHAFPSTVATENPPVDIITRVAINRLTGAADEGKLFDLEAIPPGVDFYCFVVLENLTAEQKEHFELGLKALNLQLATLGAHSTVGFGMVEVEKIFAARIAPGVFNLPVEAIIARILEPDSGYVRREPLDDTKYPGFFLALASSKSDTHESPSAEFDGQVTYLEEG